MKTSWDIRPLTLGLACQHRLNSYNESLTLSHRLFSSQLVCVCSLTVSRQGLGIPVTWISGSLSATFVWTYFVPGWNDNDSSSDHLFSCSTVISLADCHNKHVYSPRIFGKEPEQSLQFVNWTRRREAEQSTYSAHLEQCLVIMA